MSHSCKILAGLLTLLIVNCTSLQAQQPTQRQTGIYKTYQEFLDNKPSITKPFALMVDTSIDDERHDTVFRKPAYRYLDKKKRVKDVWGLCDSGVVYVNLNNAFAPMTYIGKYPFIVFNEKNKYEGGAFLETQVLSAVDILLSPRRKQLIYFKEKGEAIIATDQSIAWLLRKEKDLVDAFNKEPKSNIEIFRKYLLLLNERFEAKH